MKNIFNKGNSLIEIVLIAAIIVMLAGISIFSFKNFTANQAAKNTIEGVVSLLSEARTKTVNGYQGLQYSVYFQSDRATLFSGTTFTANLSTNKVVIFDTGITMSSHTMSDSGSQITFNKMGGTASPYGTITLSSNSQTIKTISVNGVGSITQN